MTEQNSQQNSQKNIIWLFVKKSVVALLSLTPIVFYFIVIFPWSSGYSYPEKVYYLEHYMTQEPNDTNALLGQWNRHLFVLEIDEELFRTGAFDRVLILITPNESRDTLNIDYIGSDSHSDILSHYRGTNKFYWSHMSYDIYDWGIFKDGNEYVIAIHLECNWISASIFFAMAAVLGVVIYFWGKLAFIEIPRQSKKKKKE